MEIHLSRSYGNLLRTCNRYTWRLQDCKWAFALFSTKEKKQLCQHLFSRKKIKLHKNIFPGKHIANLLFSREKIFSVTFFFLLENKMLQKKTSHSWTVWPTSHFQSKVFVCVPSNHADAVDQLVDVWYMSGGHVRCILWYSTCPTDVSWEVTDVWWDIWQLYDDHLTGSTT